MTTADPVASDWANAPADVDMTEDSALPQVPGSSSFAQVVRRSRTDSVSSHASRASRVSDGDENFWATHEWQTDFEREHYHPFNILPSRPCSAFFRTPDKDVSSADIFQELRKIDIPVTAVRCLQRNPSGHVFIPFSTGAYRKKFLEKSPWIPRRTKNVPDDASSDITYVTVYDASYELPDSAIEYRLRLFGTVLSSRRSKVPSFSSVQNGLRVYGMSLSESVLSFLRFGRYLLRVWHPQQVPTCRKCNRAGHVAKVCPNTICFNCEELGHVSHNDCRFSWHRRPASARDGDTPRDAAVPRDHPRDDVEVSQSPPGDSSMPSPSSSSSAPTASSSSAPAQPSSDSSASPMDASESASPTDVPVVPSVPSVVPPPDGVSDSALAAASDAALADLAMTPSPSLVENPVIDASPVLFSSPASSAAPTDVPDVPASSPTVSNVALAELSIPVPVVSTPVSTPALNESVPPVPQRPPAAHNRLLSRITRKSAKLDSSSSPPMRKSTAPYPVSNPRKKAPNPPS